MYGFIADPQKTIFHNSYDQFQKMPTWLYFSRASNMAMHDLTTSQKPPSNIKCLLDLNLKFIPRRRFTTYDLDDTIQRFRKQVFIQDYYLHNPHDSTTVETDSTYNHKLHIPTHWVPTTWKVSEETVFRTDYFTNSIKKLFYRRQCTPNMSLSQLNLLKFLRRKDKFIIVKSDKNLGPCILETESYIKFALEDHLNCRQTYRKLSHTSASTHMDAVRKKIQKFLYQNRKLLPKEAIRYIRTKTKECTDPFPKLYLLMKVHKQPLKTRPVVSCTGSLLHPLGVWLDTALQPIATSLPSFIASSYDLKEALNDLPPLPEGALLFTADAVSMYTNIDTFYAITSIRNFLQTNNEYNDYPLQAILDAIDLIMNNNVFQFGDVFFHQKTGTAMGTPPACCYATIYYAVKEQTLLDKYKDNLFFYRCYIDDVFGIWVPTNPTLTFDNLARDMNFHKLQWEVNQPSTTVTFLDMVLTIKNRSVETQLYEKILNLYLYISPFSSHSPGVLSGLIIGNILRIHHLCSDANTKKSFYEKFFLRLRARGYLPSQLIPLFVRGMNLALVKPMPSSKNKRIARLRLQQQQQNNRQLNSSTDTVFFHVPYHPKDPLSWHIQRIFHSNFLNNGRPTAGFNQMTIAYSRPKNLGEMLSYRRIEAFDCPPVSSNFQTRDPWAGFFR